MWVLREAIKEAMRLQTNSAAQPEPQQPQGLYQWLFPQKLSATSWFSGSL